MLTLFQKNPKKRLQKEYELKLTAAMKLQRAGKIPEYATAMAEAEAIRKRMEKEERRSI